MAPSTALVVAGGGSNAAAAAAQHDEDVDLPLDLSQLPMIPMSKSLLLINNFVANTTRFLNHFAHECEERIARVSTNLTRVEIMLAILEAKLDSVPDLEVSEAEIQAAEQSINGTAPLAPAAAEPSLGIDSQDLPSMDDGAGFVPPPPPPPPSAPMDGEEPSNQLVGVPPPPPPPPPQGLPGVDGDELSNALVLAPPTDLAPAGLFGEDDSGAGGAPVLKLKDDPIYAKYFTMRRLGIPDPVIEQKLMLDGMDPSILSMDPEGPSPSSGAGAPGGGLAPPPPSLTASSPPPPPSGNIGMPFPPPPPPISPTSSTSSRAESLFSGPPPPPPNLFPASGPPLPPMPDQDDSSSDDDDDSDGIVADALPPPPSAAAPAPPQESFLKLKDDPAFEKYFKMRKLGMPDALIEHKLRMDGVDASILSMDPEGPSPNAGGAASAPPPQGLPPPPLPPAGLPPPPPLPPVGRPGLPPPPIARYDGSDDDDFDSDSD